MSLTGRSWPRCGLLRASENVLAAEELERIWAMLPEEQVDVLCRSAPMPGIAVGVVADGGVVLRVASGTADIRTGQPVMPDTWWDLASLTKMLVTLPEVLDLVGAGALDLDTSLAEQWGPARGKPIGQATLRQVLSYDAGMPASDEYFRRGSGDSVRELVLTTPQERPAGAGAVYSDVAAMVCGFLVADMVGPLDQLAGRRTGFRFGVPAEQAAATEECPWRGRMIRGEVHDENASALGGVAGHAGAFGTLDGVLAATSWWMQRMVSDNSVWAESVREQSSNDAGERFGLGWWLTPTRGLGGRSPGLDGWGCSGFVGNRIWVEPSRGYGVVVLSNRVHPRRSDRGPFNEWVDDLLDLISRSF